MDDRSFHFDWGSCNILQVSGPDTKNFLHRLSTVSFEKPLSTLHGAFLSGQGKFISFFTAWEKGDVVHFFIEPAMFEATWNYLHKMHFSENLKIEKYVASVTEIRGVGLPTSGAIEAPFWGMNGVYILNAKLDSQTLSQEEFDFIRSQNNFPKPYVDLSEDHILIEAPLEFLIDRNKGCYPGQEVIEKIYTYGRVSRKIAKYELANPVALDLPCDVFNSQKEVVGQITSAYLCNEKTMGLGTFKRIFYEKEKQFYLHNGEISGTIV